MPLILETVFFEWRPDAIGIGPLFNTLEISILTAQGEEGAHYTIGVRERGAGCKKTAGCMNVSQIFLRNQEFLL